VEDITTNDTNDFKAIPQTFFQQCSQKWKGGERTASLHKENTLKGIVFNKLYIQTDYIYGEIEELFENNSYVANKMSKARKNTHLG
jgi:hypothetical protein